MLQKIKTPAQEKIPARTSSYVYKIFFTNSSVFLTLVCNGASSVNISVYVNHPGAK